MYPRLNYSQGSALVTGSSISISLVETGWQTLCAVGSRRKFKFNVHEKHI